MPVTLRRDKGIALTYDEMDDNMDVLKNGISGDNLFFTNKKIITEDKTLDGDRNYMSIGPIEVADGVTITVDGDWTIV